LSFSLRPDFRKMARNSMMDMPLNTLLINTGYFLMLLGLLARDILWLRIILVAAQTLLGIYAYRIGNMPMSFWNFAFVAINGVRIVGLLSERRAVRLPRAQELIYQLVFLPMTRREFLYLWELGEERIFDGQQLIRHGEKQNNLVLLLDGEVVVRKEEATLARLGRGKFVAEMSFVTGEPASADVIADGAVHCRVWPQEKIQSLDQLNPVLLIKLQKILARDLSSKIKAANQAAQQEPE